MKFLSVKRVRYTSIYWYLPAVEARPTTPRHRPRPWQTVAQIEAMYHEIQIQKEQQNHLQLGIFEKSKVHETHAQTSLQAPKDLPTHP